MDYDHEAVFLSGIALRHFDILLLSGEASCSFMLCSFL